VIAGLLGLSPPLGERGVVAFFELAGGFQAGLQRGRLQRGQKRLGDRGVDGDAADAQVPGAAAFHQLAGAGAVVAGSGFVLAVVVDSQFAAARPAGGQALQQRAAFADRAGAGLMRHRADILPDLVLVGLVGVPVDEPGVVIFDEHFPLALGQHPPPYPQHAAVADPPLLAAAAEGIGTGIGRVGEHVVHRVVGRLGPDEFRSADIGARLQRELQGLVTQP
jgi:hypothetical protein